MLTILSPAKTLEFDSPSRITQHSQPRFVSDAQQLVETLRNHSPQQLAGLMGINHKLAQLNHERFKRWEPRFDLDNAKQAIYAFRGDVYRGLDVDSLSDDALRFAQGHLAILSGLYGVLRPLDLMQPYRLEMGTKLPNQRGENLYQFWSHRITAALNEVLTAHETPVLVNLASQEYFSVLDTKQLAGETVTPVFKDWNSGRLRTVAIYAKVARGRMARWIVTNRVERPERLREFSDDGYRYSAEHSEPHRPVFVRGAED